MVIQTIPKIEYLRVAQSFHWAYAEHYNLMFFGDKDRHKRTEVMLPRLERLGRLKSLRYGKKKIYSAPRRTKKKPKDFFYGDEKARKKYENDLLLELYHVEHGLSCTEGLVRTWLFDRSGVIVPEKEFKRINRGQLGVPEWGILYPKGTMLLYEHCTEDNFYRPNNVKRKIERYQDALFEFEEHFKRQAMILFVLDVPWDVVDRFVEEIVPTGEQFWFTDYRSFLKVPMGEQLYAPIYTWGMDGKWHPLRSS